MSGGDDGLRVVPARYCAGPPRALLLEPSLQPLSSGAFGAVSPTPAVRVSVNISSAGLDESINDIGVQRQLCLRAHTFPHHRGGFQLAAVAIPMTGQATVSNDLPTRWPLSCFHLHSLLLLFALLVVSLSPLAGTLQRSPLRQDNLDACGASYATFSPALLALVFLTTSTSSSTSASSPCPSAGHNFGYEIFHPNLPPGIPSSCTSPAHWQGHSTSSPCPPAGHQPSVCK